MRNLFQLGELGIIEKFYRRFSEQGAKITLGIGDDAAALETPEKSLLLITTDIMIEGIHFKREYFTPQLLARKSLAINLSDIAAMGGEPHYFLLNLSLPGNLDTNFLEAFIDGLLEEANRYNVSLIGGDTSSSKKEIIISLTLLGQAKKGQIVSRSKAKPGHYLYVSGDIGRSAAGLSLLKAGYRLKDERVLREGISINKEEEKLAKQCLVAHLIPSPRLELGRMLATEGLAHAMIDLSDGISRDLSHICRLSKCGAIINKDMLPIAEATSYWAEKLHLSPFDLALNGGEDYELLFAIPAEKEEKLQNLIKAKRLASITRIGEIVEEKMGIKISQPEGESIPLADRGYDHFSSNK